ncbi:hypothetical protein [Akkermansia massiliensis]
MTYLKKFLARLLPAVLALSLLAGCGHGSRALSQVMAGLLSGLYSNVSAAASPRP